MSKDTVQHLAKLVNAARLEGNVELYTDLQDQMARELTERRGEPEPRERLEVDARDLRW